jgi:hypothetical protein
MRAILSQFKTSMSNYIQKYIKCLRTWLRNHEWVSDGSDIGADTLDENIL